MNASVSSGIQRAWWVFLLYGLLAIAFGIAMLAWPGRSVLALVLTFGVLSLADGVVSLLSVFRKDIALPNGLLLLYALVSVAFGVLAIAQPAQMAEALVWVLALWLVVAGIARIVFAVQVRKLVRGEWLLALSGALALVLGLLFFLRPGVGMLAVVFWIGIGALAYGALHVVAALRLRARGA